MKKCLLVCLLLGILALYSAKGSSQQNNSLSVLFGTAGNGIFSDSPGAAGFDGRGERLYGLNYVRHIAGCFAIETGLEYSVNRLLWDYEDAYDPTFRPQKVTIHMISVPVYANFTFLKYAYADAGLSVDLQTDHQSDYITRDQSGIGIFLGVGGKYAFNKVLLFVNPFVQVHAIAAFNGPGGGNLMASGLKFGVGYRF
jgi:outer membrane protein with beta-barrel domain